MGQAPSEIAVRPDAGAATRDPKPASGFQVRRIRQRRYGVIASIALLTLFSLALLLTMATNLPSLLVGRRASQSAMPAPQTAASIVHHPATGRCRQATFSNETGRVVETNRPCANDVIVDEKGAPMPMGTVRRLDAISKSFLK